MHIYIQQDGPDSWSVAARAQLVGVVAGCLVAWLVGWSTDHLVGLAWPGLVGRLADCLSRPGKRLWGSACSFHCLLLDISEDVANLNQPPLAHFRCPKMKLKFRQKPRVAPLSLPLALYSFPVSLCRCKLNACAALPQAKRIRSRSSKNKKELLAQSLPWRATAAALPNLPLSLSPSLLIHLKQACW